MITTYGSEGAIDYFTGSGFIITILIINIIHIHVAEHVQFFDRGDEPAGTLRGGRTGIAVHKLIEGGNGLHNEFLLISSLKAIRIVGTENDRVLITVNPVDIFSSTDNGGNGNIAVLRWRVLRLSGLPCFHMFIRIGLLPSHGCTTIISELLHGNGKAMGTIRVGSGHDFVISQTGRGLPIRVIVISLGGCPEDNADNGIVGV